MTNEEIFEIMESIARMKGRERSVLCNYLATRFPNLANDLADELLHEMEYGVYMSRMPLEDDLRQQLREAIDA